MSRRSRWAVLAVAVMLVLGMGESPSFAVLAGQFCADADAGVIRLADNGATVQCTLQSFGGQRRWVAIVPPSPTAPTVTASTVGSTQTGIVAYLPAPASPAGQTGIVSISPAPAATAPATAPVSALLALTG